MAAIDTAPSFNPSLDPRSIQKLAHDKHFTEAQKISESCRLFEGVLLREFLKDSLKPLIKGCLDENGSDHEIYRYMTIDTIAEEISHTQSFGFASALEAQIRKPDPITHEAA